MELGGTGEEEVEGKVDQLKMFCSLRQKHSLRIQRKGYLTASKLFQTRLDL